MSENPVFPSRMNAVCPAGHTWPVDVEWTEVTQPLFLADGTMRVALARPQYCEACFVEAPGLAVPYTSLRPIEPTVEDVHATA